MKILTKDHKYELDNFEGTGVQTIQFIEKEMDRANNDQLVTINDGTTNEEVLAMLIDRTQGLQNKFPSRETAIAITKMQEALLWLNERTRERKVRNVEGKHMA